MKQLIEDTLGKVHGLLLLAHGVDPDTDLPDVSFTTNQLVKLLKLFHDAYATVRISPIPQVAVQIAVIEYYQSQPK
jgi:ubiquinone biosynthesis protein Coq4